MTEIRTDQLVLPHRPRLLAGVAVLRRGPGEIQLGVEPSHATVVSGLPPGVERAVHQLTGRHTVTELMRRVGAPEDEDALRALLGELDALGLIDDTGTTPPARLAADTTASALNGQPSAELATLRAGASVTVHGDGRLAVAVGCLLAAAGVGRVHLRAGGTVAPEDVGTGYLPCDVGRRRHGAAQDALRRADPQVDTGPQLSHTGGTRRKPDIAVLADTVVPPADLLAVLVGNQIPHLPVRVHERTGVVGPLVLPGRSSCLRCADLRRTELDPCWPSVAAQLAGRSRQAELSCAHALAALAAAQVLRFLAWRAPQPRPPVWNAAIELDPFDSTTVLRDWPAHPRCSCGVFAHQGGRDR